MGETDPRVTREMAIAGLCAHRDCFVDMETCDPSEFPADFDNPESDLDAMRRAILAALDAGRPAEPQPLRSQWHEYTPVTVGSSAPRLVEPPVDGWSSHDLYKTGDPDAPDSIKDRNGDVVLDLCRRCNRGEAELRQTCVPVEPPKDEEVAGLVERLRAIVPTVYDAHEAAATIERLLADNARLTKERDEARALHDACAEARDSAGYLGTVVYCIEDLHTRATAAEAEVADLRARLAQAASCLRSVYMKTRGAFLAIEIGREIDAALASIKEPRT